MFATGNFPRRARTSGRPRAEVKNEDITMSSGSSNRVENQSEILKERGRQIEEDLATMVAERMETRLSLKATPSIPLKLLVLVSEFLLGLDNYGSLAALSATCKELRQHILPVLCECIVLLPSRFKNYYQKGAVIAAFLEREARHIKYLVNNSKSALLYLPGSPHSNLRLCIIRQATLRSSAAAPVDIDETIGVVVSGTVAASTLTHLVRMSSEIFARDRTVGPNWQIPRLKVLHVNEKGRIIEKGRQAGPPSWLVSDSTTLRFVNGRFTRGRLETMQYVYRGIPPSGTETLNVYLFSVGSCVGIAALETLTESLPNLWSRCSKIIPEVFLEQCQVSLDDLQNSMPAIATIYAKHAYHIPSVVDGTGVFVLMNFHLINGLNGDEDLTLWTMEMSEKDDPKFALFLGVLGDEGEPYPIYVETSHSESTTA